MPSNPIDPARIKAESIEKKKDSYELTGAEVSIQLPSEPVRYLYSGWQSWSLTAWVKSGRRIPDPRPVRMQPQVMDPTNAGEKNPNGSWYGAVELADGQIIFLGSLGLEAHVRCEGLCLHGWYEHGSGDWLLKNGEESAIFDDYARFLGERFGKKQAAATYRVWCSWYSLYDLIDESSLTKILNDLNDLPFDVFQIDDGWEKNVGDWEPNAKFPHGMEGMAQTIKSTGRKAGLWLAPLLISRKTAVYRDHQDWLLHDENGKLVRAGFNWGEALFTLDTTHPAALEWLDGLMKKIRSWGYDYAKLDFLYSGALPGKRFKDMPRESAYRQGLQVMRKALGEAYLLTCGSPIIPSLGLCDGMRIGPDVANGWDSSLYDDYLVNFAAPGARNAIRTTVNRLWLQPLVHTDPDVVYFGALNNQMTSFQRGALQDLAQIAGFKATSEVPSWLTESEKVNLATYLEQIPHVEKLSRAAFTIDGRKVDFSEALEMPAERGALTQALGKVVSGVANIPGVIRIFDALNHKSIRDVLKKNPV